MPEISTNELIALMAAARKKALQKGHKMGPNRYRIGCNFAEASCEVCEGLVTVRHHGKVQGRATELSCRSWTKTY